MLRYVAWLGVAYLAVSAVAISLALSAFIVTGILDMPTVSKVFIDIIAVVMVLQVIILIVRQMMRSHKQSKMNLWRYGAGALIIRKRQWLRLNV